jgi:hypothetical protein
MFRYIVNEIRENFPSSYGGPNRMHWLNQLLLTNGNGYQWTDDGYTLEYVGRTVRSEKPRHTAAELHAMGMERLRTMPDFVPVTKLKSFGTQGLGGFRRVLVDADQEAALAEWDMYHGTKTEAYQQMLADIHTPRAKSDDRFDVEFYLDSLAEPQSFYTVSLERYSKVAEMDDDAETDIIRAGFDVLFNGVLTQRQGDGHHQSHNQLHALILLLEKRALFLADGVWPGDAAVIGHTKLCNAEYLRLSMKEHVDNHTIDERRLTNTEFEWYRNICFEGIPDDDVELIRKYSFYRRWEKGREQEMREESNMNDRRLRRAFWNTLAAVGQVEDNLTVAYQIPEQTITNQDAVAHISGSRCIYRSGSWT